MRWPSCHAVARPFLSSNSADLDLVDVDKSMSLNDPERSAAFFVVGGVELAVADTWTQE